jgi:predicted Zn-dependent peptidase
MMMGLEDTRAVSAWNGGQALMFGDVLSVDTVNAEFDAVTTDDIARLANEYIRSEELRLAVVGPMKDASPFEAALALD